VIVISSSLQYNDTTHGTIEREREKEGEREKDREREKERNVIEIS